jgi:hypothetical protein
VAVGIYFLDMPQLVCIYSCNYNYNQLYKNKGVSEIKNIQAG